jgi:hypothetical protein
MFSPWQKLASSSRWVWLAMVLLYSLVLWGRQAGEVPQLVDWYLADLVCLPLVLGLVLMAQRMTGQSLDWTLPWWHGLTGMVAYALYFEGVLPRLNSGAVADPRDALGYLLGWVLFELLINRRCAKNCPLNPAPQ